MDMRSQFEATLMRSASAAQPVELDQQAIGRVSRIDAIQQQKMVEANRARLKIRLGHAKPHSQPSMKMIMDVPKM